MGDGAQVVGGFEPRRRESAETHKLRWEAVSVSEDVSFFPVVDLSQGSKIGNTDPSRPDSRPFWDLMNVFLIQIGPHSPYPLTTHM